MDAFAAAMLAPSRLAKAPPGASSECRRAGSDTHVSLRDFDVPHDVAGHDSKLRAVRRRIAAGVVERDGADHCLGRLPDVRSRLRTRLHARRRRASHQREPHGANHVPTIRMLHFLHLHASLVGVEPGWTKRSATKPRRPDGDIRAGDEKSKLRLGTLSYDRDVSPDCASSGDGRDFPVRKAPTRNGAALARCAVEVQSCPLVAFAIAVPSPASRWPSPPWASPAGTMLRARRRPPRATHPLREPTPPRRRKRRRLPGTADPAPDVAIAIPARRRAVLPAPRMPPAACPARRWLAAQAEPALSVGSCARS